MKKQLLLSTFITISTLAMAQTKPTIGMRAGLSEAGIQGNAVQNLGTVLNLTNGMVSTGSRTGFFAGTYVTIPLSEKIAVEPALYYTQKGMALKGNLAVKAINFLGVHASAKLNEQYIDLPVLLKATFNGFQVFAGPQLSYMANADFKTAAGVLGINLLHNKMNLTNQFNRWDAGVTGGVGYQFANGMNVTAAYDQGLARLDATNSVNAYNRSFKLGIGFRF